jgi:hypothetical protein
MLRKAFDMTNLELEDIIAEFDLLAARVQSLQNENDRLRAALTWFVENDDTNEGDIPMPEHGGRSWNEINAYWIEGLNTARAALEVKS